MSSLNSALNAAVSGLNAQGFSLSSISENVANASTTAYKVGDVAFESLVTGTGNQQSGVVNTSTSSNLEAQGAINATATTTNIALDGKGFFVVTNNISNTYSADVFTRNGNFSTDKNGYLVNDEGEYLLGRATDSTGAVTSGNTSLGGLSLVNINSVSGKASPTSKISIVANLPANAVTTSGSNSFTTSTQIYDNQGVVNNLNMIYTKTASNTWTVVVQPPTSTVDNVTVTGSITNPPAQAANPSATPPVPAIAAGTYNISFNGDGSIASVSSPTATGSTNSSLTNLSFGVTWSNGSSPSTVSLNLGKANGTSGLTQFTSTSNTPAVTISSITQDGVRFGVLSSVSITDDGLVSAKFDNGLTQTLFKIPVATFASSSGLTHVNGTVYSASPSSGDAVLYDSGSGSAGSITPSAVEGSTTDTTSELSKMIQAQQAYTASSKIITTVNSMFQSLLQAIQ